MKYYFWIAVYTIFGYAGCDAQTKKIKDFIPEGYVLYEQSFGDLNNDGQEDCILIIKGTNEDYIVVNRFDEKVDRNRRGLIVLFKNQDGYQLATENHDCFYSENEDGGVYYAPQLSIAIKNGRLMINYEHGRYGSWSYTFKHIHSDFELVGFDATRGGAVISSETNIDFLTKRKLVRENINEDAEGNDEVFKESWTDVAIEQLLNLSEIDDFEALDMSLY